MGIDIHLFDTESNCGHKKSGQGDFHLASRTLAAVLVAIII